MSDTHKAGGRQARFTPDVLAAIPQWLSMGATREEIAAVLHTTVNSLQVKCSTAGISLRGASIQKYLTSSQWVKLRLEADKRGVTTPQLIANIVGAVVDHNLFPAVLGDYDDLDSED